MLTVLNKNPVGTLIVILVFNEIGNIHKYVHRNKLTYAQGEITQLIRRDHFFHLHHFRTVSLFGGCERSIIRNRISIPELHDYFISFAYSEVFSKL